MNSIKVDFSPPDITEKEISYVVEALKSGWITTGPRTKRFEAMLAKTFGTSLCICLSSATMAMELVLHLLGIGPGDEVITSAYTYSASAAVIDHVGAKIVLVDTAEDSYFMDLEKLEKAITQRTKAIIPVDLGGVVADYPGILRLVEEKRHLFKPGSDMQRAFGRIVVMADAAHSIGASLGGVPSGALADFSAFSFHAVKNLTTAEGGAITWREHPNIDNVEVYQDLQLLSLHGQSKDALSKMKLGSWEYDIVHPGYKCNMTDINAALGLAQLERFPEMSKKRMATIAAYDQAFLPLGIKSLQHRGEGFMGNGHLYLTRVPGMDEATRNLAITRMAQRGIACNVHFKPLPLFTGYQKLGFNIRDYPRAYAQYANGISLPSHSLLSAEQVQHVIDSFIAVLRELAVLPLA